MINIKMQPAEIHSLSPRIAVIGVGGAGGNAVNNMISSNLDGCEFLVCNTDSQALGASLSENRVQLGANVTGGLGAGSKPEVGQAAAEESLEEVLRYLDGANMAFVTAGMGGGTGTGAAPVIAKACRQQGILTVGVVTKPFHFEGARRMEQAEAGIAEMQQYVDTLIVIPNQNLFRIADEKTTFAEAFKMADTVLQSGVRGVTDLMVRPGLVNLDFADIRTAMLQMGKAMMGTGEASGDKRAVEAAEAAINNPLLDDVSMKGANGVIINVTGGYDMTLFEADEACNRIRDEVDPGANIIFGATFDDTMEGFMRVSIVATGIEVKEEKEKTGGSGSGGQGKSFGGTRPAANTSPAPSVSAPAAAVSQDAPATRERPASALSGREVIRGLKAPAPISSPVAQPATTVAATQPVSDSAGQKETDTGSLDMFEQAEFSNLSVDNEQTALRGTTYNDTFIPPKPVEPQPETNKEPIGSHESSFHGMRANKEDIPPETGLRLNPPRMATPTARTSATRGGSLLERITGSVQQHIENFRDDGGEFGEDKKGTTTPSTAPSQGSLNISTPVGKPAVKLDDELDIPAFLRRQAN